MGTELTKTEASPDGFAGFEDRIEGEEGRQNGFIRGQILKFTNESTWCANGKLLPADLRVAVVDIVRVEQKWGPDHRPVETIILEPEQKFRNLDQVNLETPRDDWITGPDGASKGPWQRQFLLYLVDLMTMDTYTWPASTVGAMIAVRELRERVELMRKFRGAAVHPVVQLADTPMKTRFGARQRPHLVIVSWEMLVAPASTPRLERQSVSEPSLSEELGDKIKY